MPELFDAKIRKVGTSLGLLIPKEIIDCEKIREGEKIKVAFLKQKRLEVIEKAFGIAKGAKYPFIRDRTDRLERY